MTEPGTDPDPDPDTDPEPGSETGTGTDPHAIEADARHAFWADAVADEIEARDPEEPIVIKGGISPSGVPHLGNMNEVVLGWFVAEVLRERGHRVRQVFTADDRDPLRKLPRKLADLDGNVVDLGEVNAGALGRNLGKPYTAIPDPFGCCDSYGDHFATLIADSADRLGIEVELVSNTELYESGAFEDVTREVLANRERAREVLAAHQDTVDESYVPFRPICAECGQVTGTDAVREVDLDRGVVAYRCGDIEAGGRTIEGCGHEDEATLREGKLPWRFEWPAQWRVLGVDFEPFGKDHAEGSWPSGEEIAREVLGDEPPVPMTYEWFTLNGEPFSSSAGNVLLVHEVLDLIEREALLYFFAKDPRRARDFDVDRLDALVNEFDRFERVHFGAEPDAGETERRRAERIYPFLVEDATDRPLRIPYTYAAVLGMTDDRGLRERMARRAGHLPEEADLDADPDPDPDRVDRALARVPLARNWAVRTDNEYNYRLAEDLPDVSLGDATRAALAALADFIETERPDGETLQGEIYEIAREHDVEMGTLFGAGYRLFLDDEEGPRLGPLLAALETTFVVRRLRLEA